MPSRPELELLDLLFTLVGVGINVGCLVLFVVLTCLSYRQVRFTWRRGLLIGLVALLLAVPSVVVSMACLDLSRLTHGEIPSRMLPYLQVAVGMMALLIVVLQIPFRAVYYHVAAVEWGRVRGASVPEVSGPRDTRLLGSLVGLGVGGAAAVLSAIAFYVLGIEEGQGVKDLQRMFPGLMDMPGFIMFPTLIAFFSSAALVEELVFRGGLLGFLLRITGNHPLAAWSFIVLTSLLWALQHYANTDTPSVKILQIFVIGVALGWMARRWGLISAICGHLGLNVTAVTLAFMIPGLD